MRPTLLALALLSVAAVAEAQPQCPPPSGPLASEPTYTFFANDAQFTIWRHPDGILKITVLFTPLAGPMNLPVATLTQGGQTRIALFFASYTAELKNCFGNGPFEPIKDPIALGIGFEGIGPFELEPDLNETFTLTVGLASIVIPKEQAGVQLVVDGCSPCSAGQLAAFHARVERSGPANVVAGVILPNGTSSAWFSTSVSGAGDVPLPAVVVPAEAPDGIYVLQVSLLDPALGTTIARGVAKVEKR